MSVEIFPEGQPEKKLGQAMEELAAKDPERAKLLQHRLEEETFGGDAAPAEPPAEIDIGYLAEEKNPAEKGKEALN